MLGQSLTVDNAPQLDRVVVKERLELGRRDLEQLKPPELTICRLEYLFQVAHFVQSKEGALLYSVLGVQGKADGFFLLSFDLSFGHNVHQVVICELNVFDS